MVGDFFLDVHSASRECRFQYCNLSCAPEQTIKSDWRLWLWYDGTCEEPLLGSIKQACYTILSRIRPSFRTSMTLVRHQWSYYRLKQWLSCFRFCLVYNRVLTMIANADQIQRGLYFDYPSRFNNLCYRPVIRWLIYLRA